MRRLAAAAGVKPMSLYHHFPSKEAILLGVAESIAAAALGDPRSQGRWQERVRLLFVGLYELVQAHPRALPLSATAVLRTPSGRLWMEELMSVLLEAGFTPADAAGPHEGQSDPRPLRRRRRGDAGAAGWARGKSLAEAGPQRPHIKPGPPLRRRPLAVDCR